MKPVSEKPVDANKTKKPLPASKALKNNELSSELQSLRSAHKEILSHHALQVDTRIVELLRCLRRENAAEAAIPVKTINVMLKKIRALKLKPKKGRIKDLLAVHKAVKALMNKVVPG